MAVESWWRQEAMGDPTTVSNPQDYPAFSRIAGSSDVMTDRGYGPGQEWLSIGAWFNPYPWNNQGQQDYVRKVQQYLRDRVWEQPDFLSG